jgi:hypothetical protein
MTKTDKSTGAEKVSCPENQGDDRVKECADLVSFYLKRYLSEREKERGVENPS